MSEMNGMEFVTRLADEMVKQLRSPIPLQIDLWDVATIAKYLKRSETQVRDRLICLPDFPKAFRLPSANGRGHPLFRATEVISWVENHREKH